VEGGGAERWDLEFMGLSKALINIERGREQSVCLVFSIVGVVNMFTSTSFGQLIVE
jgi:hypothetical protein